MGLAAMSLPDPINQLPNILKEDNNILFQAHWLATDTTVSPNTHRGYYAVFQVGDLKKEVDLDTLDGTSFIDAMKTFLNKKKKEKSLRHGWKIADANGKNQTHPHFICEGNDFILHNVDVKLTEYSNICYPSFHIKSKLAVAMGWFVNKGNNNFELGSNLVLEIPEGSILNPIDLPSPSKSKFWNYGTATGLIDLSMTCNWRFKNLNKAFERVVEVREPGHRLVA